MKDLKQEAIEFCRINGIMTVNDNPAIGMSKFAQHLVERGVLTDPDRCKSIEKEHEIINRSNENHIAILENQVKKYQKIIDTFIDSKGKVITDENKQVIQRSILLLRDISEGDFVSKNEAKDACIALHNLMVGLNKK